MAEGETLPSVREMSSKLALSPATVHRTYAELQNAGFVNSMSGRGFFVAPLSPANEPTGADVQALIKDLFLPAFIRAQSLGFSRAEVLAALQTLFDGQLAQGHVHMLFLGSGEASVAKYVGVLSSFLRTLPCKVSGVNIAATDDLEAELALNYPEAQIAVCLSTVLPEVQPATVARGIPLRTLLTVLSEESERYLMSVQPGSRIAVVAEERYQANLHSMVQQITGIYDIISVTSEVPDVSSKLADCNVVVHSISMAAVAIRDAPEDAKVIECKFVPRGASLRLLREAVMNMIDDPVDDSNS